MSTGQEAISQRGSEESLEDPGAAWLLDPPLPPPCVLGWLPSARWVSGCCPRLRNAGLDRAGINYCEKTWFPVQCDGTHGPFPQRNDLTEIEESFCLQYQGASATLGPQEAPGCHVGYRRVGASLKR